MMKTTMKDYNELVTFLTFQERLLYLSSIRSIGETSFGHERYLNQNFYRSVSWKRIRNFVILRDQGCDLGIIGYEIHDLIIIHHINPLTVYDIENLTEFLTDPKYLITTSKRTHQIIHYGGEIRESTVNRKPNDHILWK